MQDEFCSICEKKLTKKDSDHVCRKCFRQAREQKKLEVKMSDRAAETLGLGIAFGSLLTWGLGKLAESVKLPEMEASDARAKLAKIQTRLKGQVARDVEKELRKKPKRRKPPGPPLGEK